jgi:hypothetical protein
LLAFPLLSSAAPPEGAVLETFAIDREGGPFLVPVTIQGKTYPFVLDTGSSCAIFDQKLRPLLGKAAGEKVATTPRGEMP